MFGVKEADQHKFPFERGASFVRQAQSTRTAKFDPRTLSRKCSRKCTRDCTRRCPRKWPRRLRFFSVQNAPEGPHEDSHESAHGKLSSAHGKFSNAHENVHESVLGQFSHVLFSHVLFLGHFVSPNKHRTKTHPNVYLSQKTTWGISILYVKSPPERVPGDKFLSLRWKMWWNFRKFGEWQILSHFPWENMKENLPPKIHRLFTLGVGVKKCKISSPKSSGSGFAQYFHKNYDFKRVIPWEFFPRDAEGAEFWRAGTTPILEKTLREWMGKWNISCFKHRQVTDVDVTDLGFSGPRMAFYATGALWGRVTPFSRSLV